MLLASLLLLLLLLIMSKLAETLHHDKNMNEAVILALAYALAPVRLTVEGVRLVGGAQVTQKPAHAQAPVPRHIAPYCGQHATVDDRSLPIDRRVSTDHAKRGGPSPARAPAQRAGARVHAPHQQPYPTEAGFAFVLRRHRSAREEPSHWITAPLTARATLRTEEPPPHHEWRSCRRDARTALPVRGMLAAQLGASRAFWSPPQVRRQPGDSRLLRKWNWSSPISCEAAIFRRCPYATTRSAVTATMRSRA